MDLNYQEDKAIVSIDKKLDLTNADEMDEITARLMEKEFEEVVLDFSGVEMIDSIGMGKILLLNRKLTDRDCELRIRNVDTDYVRKMFKMVKLDEVLEIDW
ncbi:STAS domain-containing protein [Halarsenatibacter silvermanii]|uniref:Anti-sigma B factor antagonist n=1 Tax=Halarsenatibacter silvermanii TaxID=321763 RepID=A0A1G9J017_9FIRM|nr:STAS domain-containing protein [Halarsenatibacter silvermanii]SDL30474.1 anti-sigma B factor antagonist [Halarsenatibacter silvermanii]